MNEAKENILNQIQSGLGRGPLPEAAKEALDRRLASPDRSVIPERIRVTGQALVQEFLRMTTGEATTVSKVERQEDIPETVATYLREKGLPESVVIAPDPAITEMPWGKSGIRVHPGRAEAADLTSITPAFAGIAETGCMMLLSGPKHPYTLNFLPENHIVVLKSNRIVAAPEDAFKLIKEEFGQGRMPRTVLMVAGPSRSGDIGTALHFGAHGPKRLHCILVD